MTEGALAGFRILDLTSVVSGPFCTMLLGDLGADVIKVEPPQGDATRTAGGAPKKNGFSAAFLNFNRNKRSVVIDIKQRAGRDLVRRLAERADALLENNRPGVAERLGVGYQDIRRLNPKIVYCSICGFGPNGRLANFPAYDPVIQGYSGMAQVQAARGGLPSSVRMALADKVSGMTAALSVVAALHAARSRGAGQYIRIPMLAAMIAFTATDTLYAHTFIPEDEFKDQVPRSTSLDPFKTKDGWLTIAPYTDAQYQRLCAAVGHPEWWSETPNRLERARGVMRGLAKVFPERTTAEWLSLLEAADVPCGPVHSYETLFNDEEIVANQNFTIYEHPAAGTVRTANPGPRFSETPRKMWRMPPGLGEHTEEVLTESGLSRGELEELRAAKVIN